MDVIKLLRSKNGCLARLLGLCSSFLERGELSGLEGFQLRRDAIFKAIELYDRKIAEALSTLSSELRTPELLSRARAALAEKDRLVQEIILRDNELMARIEREREGLLAEIVSSRKTRELVGKFKSAWIPGRGEEVDRNL